ncbi:hypothetical protein EE612_009766 [Oryza sativa]|nr:hypothetical protein EE612_009766 [Oryza sativa]
MVGASAIVSAPPHASCSATTRYISSAHCDFFPLPFWVFVLARQGRSANHAAEIAGVRRPPPA